jgi:NAD(P)-dependent dehydrogenase (short-subunit alcohol dehydrogenase family)
MNLSFENKVALVTGAACLDAAFNNAGVQSLAVETAESTSEEFDRVNAINLKSAWLCMKYELLQMRNQETGAIVNNSSIGGLIGIPGRPSTTPRSTA